MDNEEFETYDFLINDEDEAMLLLYVRPGEPKESTIDINREERSGILHRNAEDDIVLQDIPAEVIDSLTDADKLLVCEMSIEEKEEDTQIVYAYEAEIND